MRIGDGSWLGYGTVVLPGATIGRHVVVGANSVVTGEIPDYCVAVGSPGPGHPPLRPPTRAWRATRLRLQLERRSGTTQAACRSAW